MHLKKLEIQGFKSFPEYTLIEFDKGMTAVVGPNGSGKSNVTDAIRWVLGEQSVRTLRGGKMEDVIFNGTQSRRAMNYAEVSMTIDNSDGSLGIEYAEVQITRRLFRSGESEYQINHVNCRLKDIVTLFMDTGLGKDGYSIVGQGRVDEILSTRSEDRRKVLEEASGIVKYKVRKEEAERKLLSTEQNLVRIGDILAELADQIGPLLEQSEKARKYHRLYDEWKTKDMGLSLYLINRNNAFLSASIEERNVISEDIRMQEDTLLAMRTKNRGLSERSNMIEDSLEESRSQLTTVSDAIHIAQSSLAVIADRKLHLTNRIHEGESNSDNTSKEIERLEQENELQQKKVTALQSQQKKFSEMLAEKEAEMDALTSEIDQSQRQLAILRKRVEDLQDELFEGRERAQQLASEMTVLDSRVHNLSNDRMLLITELDGQKVSIEEATKALSDTKNKLSESAINLEKKKSELEKVRECASNVSAQLEQKKREADNCKFRIRTLEELEKSREGYQEPVRRLLAASESDKQIESAMKGVLGELIRVPAQYETAIEIALGQAVHHIVTQTDKDASYLITILKDGHMGRVTFLPIDVIKPRELETGYRKAAEIAKGYLGIASDLLEFPAFLSDIMSNLLGRIVITETLQQALLLASQTGHSFRIVTLDGDVVNPGGSMTGGSIRRTGTSILGRARELEATQNRLVSVDSDIEEIMKNMVIHEQDIKKTGREVAFLDESVRTLTLEHVKIEAMNHQLQAQEDKILSRKSLIEKELEDISKRRLMVKEDQDDCQVAISECEAEMLALRQSVTKTDGQSKAVQDQLDDLRSEIGDLRISVGSIEESFRGATEISERILREKDGYTDGLIRYEKECAQFLQEISLLTEEENVRTAEIVDHRNREKMISMNMKDLQLEKEELEQELSGFIDRLSSATSRLSSLQNEQAKLQAKVEKYETDVDEWKNRMWEEHEMTYDNAQSYAIEIENPQAFQKQISELKNEMRDIGAVNLASIDEYDRVNDRFTFMTKQKDDIEAAKDNLEKVISDMVKEMRQQFLIHFEQINENFKTVFSDLFNGGTADIILEDLEDVLSCGIDIRAQPPGKKLQSLSLLSGGERCLTAIALLFAILQLRPSPFCVLDEVEAALDDVNVNRFTDFVRRYTAKSQFILVTHRKGTMEACDRMYGVTMQERGISKILSMRLGES